VVNGLLVAAIKESVLANVNAVRQAGLNPVQVDLIPFALSRVLIRGALTKGTVAIVDIGASTTNVVVVTAGVPQFVRMIPVGGEDLTKSLVNRLEISPEQAEAAKRARGLSTAPVGSEGERQVAEIIHSTTTELLNSLRNTINYFVNAHHNEPIDAIVLGGGGAQLIGFAQALSAITRIQVIPADAFGTVDVSRAARTAGGASNDTMSVALGLALGSVA
jgi:type IV pilus assembly protein PilM